MMNIFAKKVTQKVQEEFRKLILGARISISSHELDWEKSWTKIRISNSDSQIENPRSSAGVEIFNLKLQITAE